MANRSQLFSNTSEPTAAPSPSSTLISLRIPADEEFKLPLVR
jgi:hypothetical protein